MSKKKNCQDDVVEEEVCFQDIEDNPFVPPLCPWEHLGGGGGYLIESSFCNIWAVPSRLIF